MTQRQSPRVHEQWAQLRFSVVGQLLAAPPEKGALAGTLAALAAREWCHPTIGAPVRFGASTIERWYYRASASATIRSARSAASAVAMPAARRR